MKQAISLVFVFLLSIPTFGQVKSSVWWETAESRQAHALKLQRDFKALSEAVPTLSPREERWLKAEYDDTIAANGGHFTKRAVDATETREWSIRVAKPHVEAIDYELAMLGTRLTPSLEARHWTRLAALLMDFEFWQAIDDLQQRRVIDKQQLKFLGALTGPNATLWAEQILNEVVLPYLDTNQ